MNKTQVKSSNTNSEGKLYLTKRILVSAAKKASRAASQEVLETRGYNLIAEQGWLLKCYADGTKERIKKLPEVNRPNKIVLI